MGTLSETSWKEPQLPRTQEQLLRSMAPRMPWYLQPPEANGLVLQDFSQFVHQRVRDLMGLGAEFNPNIGSDLSLRRPLIRHFIYAVLLHSKHAFTDGYTEEKVAEILERDLKGAQNRGFVVAEHPHHPLYSSQSQTRPVSLNGYDVRVFDLKNKADKNLMNWLLEQDYRAFLDRMPELMTYSRNVKVTHHAADLRLKLQQLLWDSIDPPPRDLLLTNAQREEFLDAITEYWVESPDSDGMRENAVALAQKMGVQHVFDWKKGDDALLKNILSKVKPERIKNVAEEAEWNPLLQQLIFQLVLEGKYEEGADLAGAWARKLIDFQIPPCDRPTTCLASLAGKASDTDSTVTEVLERL